MRNGIKPMLCQLDAIAERVTGPSGTMDSLRAIRAALLDTFDHIEAEIRKREAGNGHRMAVEDMF